MEPQKVPRLVRQVGRRTAKDASSVASHGMAGATTARPSADGRRSTRRPSWSKPHFVRLARYRRPE